MVDDSIDLPRVLDRYLDADAPATDRATSLLLPLQPENGLGRLLADVEHLRELDSKMGSALAMVEERLSAFDADDLQNVIVPLLWIHVRARLDSMPYYNLLRTALRDGDRVRHATRTALGSILDERVLDEVVRRVQASDDDGIRAQLRTAREQLDRASSADFVVAAIVVLVIVDTVLIAADVHMIATIATSGPH